MQRDNALAKLKPLTMVDADLATSLQSYTSVPTEVNVSAITARGFLSLQNRRAAAAGEPALAPEVSPPQFAGHEML